MMAEHYGHKGAIMPPTVPGRRFVLRCAAAMVMAAVMILCLVSPARPAQRRVLFREDFNDLASWRPVYFRGISSHTRYAVEKDASGAAFLAARSDRSASALLHRSEFNVYEYPRVRWRWKVDSVYKNLEPDRKTGDDYPMRVYIVFKYDPGTAGTIDRALYGIARTFYGEYPPHSTLNYVWANNREQKRIMKSPYTPKAMVIALESGADRAGTWVDEEVDILRDYREAFGVDPPPVAGIAVMNDSDDSGQASLSYLDYIEVFRDGE